VYEARAIAENLGYHKKELHQKRRVRSSAVCGDIQCAL